MPDVTVNTVTALVNDPYVTVNGIRVVGAVAGSASSVSATAVSLATVQAVAASTTVVGD